VPFRAEEGTRLVIKGALLWLGFHSCIVLMKAIKYCVYKEAPYYVAQCLNVDVSSFGENADVAVANLKEAVELYFEDSPAGHYKLVDEAFIGEVLVHG